MTFFRKFMTDSDLAIRKLVDVETEKFTAGGTWVKPKGASSIEITVIAGGGGSGGDGHAVSLGTLTIRTRQEVLAAAPEGRRSCYTKVGV